MPGSNVGSHFLNGWEWQARIRFSPSISPCTGPWWLSPLGEAACGEGERFPPPLSLVASTPLAPPACLREWAVGHPSW